MINPATGLEDPTYKPNAPTQVSAGVNQQIQDKYDQQIASGNTKNQAISNIKGSLQQGGSFDTLKNAFNQGGVEGGWIANNKPAAPMQAAPVVQPSQSTTAAAPVSAPVSAPVTVPAPTTVAPTKPEYMSQADFDKIQNEGTKNIKDAYASYNIAKGQYEQNKNYYTNFDEKNNQYSNVLNSLQTAQAQNQNAPVTDAQYQAIAAQYGLTPDQVKNPLTIFSDRATGLKMTEEGSRKLGTTGAQQNIDDAQKNYDRTKADLAIKTQQTQNQFQQQIDDVQKNLQRNIDWMQAQGAWSGANRSSGYLQGIENVKADGEQTIDRLKTLAESAKTADATNVSRITEDFTTGITRAKTALDDQMKEVNQSAGLQLAGLTEQYGLGNKTLTTQLDKIMQDMDTKTAAAQAQYINNLKAIQGIASENINQFSKLQELTDAAASKRSDELLANGGAILQNTSLTTLADSVKNGTISPQKYEDLKSYMLSGIQAALGKIGTVTPEDTQTIENLLDTGSTPAEAIAKLQATGRFKKQTTIDKTFDVGGETWVQYTDGKIEKIKKSDTATPGYKKLDDNLYQDENGNIVTRRDIEAKAGISGNGLRPSGRQSNVLVSGKNIIVDSAGAPGLESANSELVKAGIPVVVASGFRDQKETIRNMASQFGIPFNEANPAETAKKLRDSGHQVADPGKSNHETGMAIDVYANGNLGAVTPEQERILNKNGWFSAGIPGDAGHFEYKGASKEYSPSDATLLEKVLAGTATAADRTALYRKGLTDEDADIYAEQQQQEKQNTPYQSASSFQDIVLSPKATAEQQKSKAYADRMNRAADALLVSEKEFANSGLTSQLYQENVPNALKSAEQQSLEANKQNFITAVLRQESGASISPTEFAKEEKKYFPQPGDSLSVVAEKQNAREAAIKGMYSQSGKDEDGKPVASYYVPKKIYEDGSYIKYDNAGNYNYVDKDGKESGWKPVGQEAPKETVKSTTGKSFSKEELLNAIK